MGTHTLRSIFGPFCKVNEGPKAGVSCGMCVLQMKTLLYPGNSLECFLHLIAQVLSQTRPAKALILQGILHELAAAVLN